MEVNYHYQKFCEFLGIPWNTEIFNSDYIFPQKEEFFLKTLIDHFFPLTVKLNNIPISKISISSLTYKITEEKTKIRGKVKTEFLVSVRGDKVWETEVKFFELPTLYPEGSFYLRSGPKQVAFSQIKCRDGVTERIPIGQIIKAPGPHIASNNSIKLIEIKPYYGKKIYIKPSKNGKLVLVISSFKEEFSFERLKELIQNPTFLENSSEDYLLLVLNLNKNKAITPFFYLSPLGRKRLNEVTGLNIENSKFLEPEDLLFFFENIDKLEPTDFYDLNHKFVRTYSDYLVAYLAPYFYNIAKVIETEIKNRFNENLFEHPSSVKDLLKNIFTKLDPSSKILSSLFNSSNFIQIHKRTNPIQDYEHRLKLTFLGSQGIQDKQARCLRDIHKSYKGRICPVEVHQGVDVGLNCYFAKGATLNEYNQIIPGNDGHFLSPAALLVPFIQFNDGARIMMGINNIRQAVTLQNPELPLIQTGYEKEIGEKIIKDWERKPFPSQKIYGFTGWKFQSYLDPKRCLKENIPCIGVNLLAAFMFWEGYTFEDGIVISESAAKKLTTLEVVTQHFVIWGNEITTKDLKCLSEGEKSRLDRNGIIKEGEIVKPGDVIIGKICQRRKEIGKKVEWIEVKVKAREDFYGKVIEVKRDIYYPNVPLHIPLENKEKIIKTVIRIRLLRERPVQIGDKLTNRHGNKGVVSLILPDDEMPHLPDGTPVEIILNPIGVIARMNIGQLLEAHFSWLAKKQGQPLIFKPFEPIKEDLWNELKKTFKEFGLDELGRVYLQDKHGNKITDFPVTVGYVYTLRPYHIAEDKVNVRSISAYSVVTQQPFRGKKKYEDFYLPGGQRFGEMEVWALEAHYTPKLLDELLTKKSDDLLLKENKSKSIPHSFRNVAIILRTLGIDLYAQDQFNQKIDLTKKNIKNASIKSVKIELIPPEKIPEYMPVISLSSFISKYKVSEILEDPEYFGNPKDYFARSTSMGCIELPTPLFNPFLEREEFYLPFLPVNLRINLQLTKLYKKFLLTLVKYRNLSEEEKKRELISELQIIFEKILDLTWDLLIGKYGFIRKYCLGKRVDYSGRLVCVPDQNLDIDTVGLHPDFVKKLAGHLISSENEISLENFYKDKVVLIIRFPTLHKMNVQAFRVKIDKKYKNVIGIPPVICAGFNADFDGDEFSIHLPLSSLAQLEAKEKCMIDKNWFSPANGSISPLSITKEIVAGIYYLTSIDQGREELAQRLKIFKPKKPWKKKNIIKETEKFLRSEKSLEEKKRFLKELQNLGFYWAKKAGFSANYFELKDLYEKVKDEAEKIYKSAEIESQGKEKKEFVEFWYKAQGDLKKAIINNLEPSQPLYYLFISGADKKTENLSQVVGFRGLVGRLGGEVVHPPVKGNLINGLNEEEFFICAFGARKGVVEKKLATSDSGYLARQMVEASHFLRITEKDCGTTEGLEISPNSKLDLNKFIGRFLAKPVVINGKKFSVDKPLFKEDLELLATTTFQIRSPIFCKSKNGICQKCYGLRPDWQTLPEIGYPVGILASQTISEPSTQLALRSFHQGGIATHDVVRGLPGFKNLLNTPADLSNSEDIITLLQEVQEIFEYFGQNIFHIHFEVLFRAMMVKYPEGRIMYPLSEVSFKREGFLSAMSFEKQRKVIIEAAQKNKEDKFLGLKEKIIIGKEIKV